MSGQGISESVHPRQQQRTFMTTLGKAIAIAAQAHQDQYDKAGAPIYFASAPYDAADEF